MTIKLEEVRNANTLSSVLSQIAIIYFYNEAVACPYCRVRLLIQKVKTRTIYSVGYGKIIIKEYVHDYPCCEQVFAADEVAKLVKKGCNYSYDCLVEAGKLRYLEKRQIEEIRHIFHQNYHIPISTTQVRRLCYQFLLYLGKFHYLNVTRINQSIAKRGGYILHIDSTCEGRKPHLLTCLDGLSGYVLYSKKISGENEAELTIAFQRVKMLFDIPLCIVHDMGIGINKAAALVFSGIPQVICHFHLLRDIGKDLFEAEYRKLQQELSRKKIYARLRYQLKTQEELIGNKKEAQQLFLGLKSQNELSPLQLMQGILYGYLLALKSHENTGDGYGVPFDRPKVHYYYKIIEVYEQIEQLELKKFCWEDKEKSRLYQTKDVLRKVVNDKSLRRIVKTLEKKMTLFDELRQIMRIALPDEKNGLNDSAKIENPSELDEMEKKLTTYVNKLKRVANKNPLESKQVTGVIKQLEKYWDKIFAKPIKIKKGNNEKIIIPQRTNNLSEQFYRRLKQLFRRLHGRRHVGKDLLFLPEEIALIENLKNKNYINDLLGSLDRLAEEFAQLDIDSVEMPFEKEEIDPFVPQKIINALKTFKPMEYVAYFMKN